MCEPGGNNSRRETWSGQVDARSWTVNGRGPCRVVERLGEVVYRVRLPPRGRRVALHRDRLAPYRGAAVPVQPTSGPRGTPDTASGSSPATLGCSDTTTSSPGVGPPDVESVPSMVDYIRPAHLRDFVCPLEEARDFERGGVV